MQIPLGDWRIHAAAVGCYQVNVNEFGQQASPIIAQPRQGQ